MQKRLSALGGFDYWSALATALARNRLSRIAFLYDQWLGVKEYGLAELRSEVFEPSGSQAEALSSYETMLEKMRAVARTAERGNFKAYKRAYLNMIVSITATRDVFKREGAPNICNYPI